MKNNWKEFNFKQNYRELNNTMEVKLNNNKVISIWNIVGGNVLDSRNEEINTDDILFFRPKKDYNRYKKLQKHHELLEKYDFDTLDNFEFAIYDTYTQQEDRDKITKLFKKLKNHIEKAQEQILIESKTYL